MAAAVAATDAPTFPLFSKLPLELRDQIWREAMPDEIEPALHFYKGGCWEPRRLTPGDEGYNATNDELNLELTFCYKSLDAVHIDMPLFFVNHEARRNVLTWVRKQSDIQMHIPNGRQLPIFSRFFDPDRDALYVPLDKWHQFVTEADERVFESDLVDQLINTQTSDITCLAFPMELYERGQFEILANVMARQFCSLELLLFVSESPQNLEYVDPGSLKVQRRWRFEKVKGESIIWDIGDECFRTEVDENNDDLQVSKLFHSIFGDEAEPKERLAEALAQADVYDLKIQHVVAVRG